MRKALLVAPAVALIVVLGACEDEDGGDGDVTIPSPGVTVSVQQDNTPIGEETPGAIDVVAEEVCQPNPAPASAEFQVLEQPTPGGTVTSPVTISGQVLAFENVFQVAILDANGDPVVEPVSGLAEAAEIGQLAPFSIDVAFQVTEQTPACIWVYELSARDGSQIHVGQIPVLLSP